jgi:hypothetical protein
MRRMAAARNKHPAVAATLAHKPEDYVRELLVLRQRGALNSALKFEKMLAHADSIEHACTTYCATTAPTPVAGQASVHRCTEARAREIQMKFETTVSSFTMREIHPDAGAVLRDFAA